MVLMNQVQLTNYKLNSNESLLNVFLYQSMLLKKVVVIVLNHPRLEYSKTKRVKLMKLVTNLSKGISNKLLRCFAIIVNGF